MKTAIHTPPAVRVEYDCRGKRAAKEFADANAAKRFYATKEKDGKNPKVLKPEPPKKGKASKQAKPTAQADAPAKQDAAKQPEAKPASPGVRKSTRTKGFLAAQVIRRHGLDAGVTPEMVAELDELSGKPSPTQSRFDLAFAWHVVRGWQDEDGGAA